MIGMAKGGRGAVMSAAENNMLQVLELKPVRDYSTIREDALQPFLRAAAGSTDGLDQRVKDFRTHVVRVLGSRVFNHPREQLLTELKDEARTWGLNFDTDPTKVLEFVEQNPVALRLPLNKLLQVPASHDTLLGVLADAIESIVVRIVLNSNQKDIQEALQRARAASSLGGGIGHPGLSALDVTQLKQWPFPALKQHTFQYLDKVVEEWVKNTASIQQLVPDELHSFMIHNAPRTEALAPSEKIDLLRKSKTLPLAKVAPILRKMNAQRNNVGDVVSASLDSALLENAVKWFEEVGRGINWGAQFSSLLGRGDQPSDSSLGEDGKTVPPHHDRDMPTRID